MLFLPRFSGGIFLLMMDPRFAGETLKHFEVDSNLLMDAHRSMSNEMHILKKAASNADELDDKQECSKNFSLCDQVTKNEQKYCGPVMVGLVHLCCFGSLHFVFGDCLKSRHYK
ncbi:unnamed protein product [Cuscuta epithymum]|uniref:Uncharacterized protein n=2 Tax=Cuscuta epithymum TaxID=186058 RepID=A0AAV0D849_9ASTE|nr:unnamed protein product [Cuscuta epithymum]